MHRPPISAHCTPLCISVAAPAQPKADRPAALHADAALRKGDNKKVKEALPTHIANLERLLAGNEHFVPGFGFSLADVAVFDVLFNFYQAQVPDCLAGFPGLHGVVERTKARPGIAAYLASAQCKAIDRMVLLPD
eukprot:SAG22_NODE_12318_length_447_cov_0.893678_2_plen_134_part_01